MSLHETADQINALFHTAGLDHDVVRVEHHVSPYGVVHIDPASDQPVTTSYEEITFVGAGDTVRMGQFLFALEQVFERFPPGQLKLF